METNSKKVLAALPDFDDYMKLAEQVKILSLGKMQMENKIKEQEALAFQRVMNDPAFFRQGKAVSVSYFENSYKHCGITGEILELRNRYSELSVELEAKKTQFEIYRQMHDLYKALAYQERGMS